MKKKSLIVFMSMFAVATSCTNQPGGIQGKDSVKVSKNLKQTNNSELLKYFKTAKPARPPIYYDLASPLELSVAKDVTSVAEAPTSSTNLQEQGVDESDKIKFDGNYIYSVSDDYNYNYNYDYANIKDNKQLTVQVTDVRNTDNGNLVTSHKISFNAKRNAKMKGIYLNKKNNQLISVIGDNRNFYNDWFRSYSFSNNNSEVNIVDIKNPTAPVQKYNYKFDGTILSTRRNNDVLYVVLRYYPKVYSDIATPNSNYIDTSKLPDNIDEYLPHYTINNSSEKLLVSAKDCYLEQDSKPGADVISLVSINLNSPESINSLCFIGSSEAIYASQKSFYVATTKHSYNTNSKVNQYNEQEVTTDIHKFSYSGTNLEYKGSGEVQGHLGYDQSKKSFRFSEHDGYLRVVTMSRPAWFGISRPFLERNQPTTSTSSNNQTGTSTTGSSTNDNDVVKKQEDELKSPVFLNILTETDDGKLAVISSLPNKENPSPIGKPGEKLYASRFIGDKAYFITFKTTDPLYIINLSDPYNPKISGELEIDGYSDYLHPIGNDLLLGIGKDAIPDNTDNGDEARGSWYQGVKLSLIDISNPRNPREVHKKVIGKRGTEATVLEDHHGIAVVNNNGTYRVSMPISLHDKPYDYTYGKPNEEPNREPKKPWHRFKFTNSGLYSFEIDTANQIIKDKSIIVNKKPRSEDVRGDRSIIHGDNIYYLHKDSIVKASW